MARTKTVAGRLAAGLAGAAAMTLVVAGSASAHHCYKDWSEAAQARLAAGGTPWMPLSDMAEMFGAQLGCDVDGDAVVAAWMEATGADAEPLILSTATAGGGAAHKKGKAPGPFHYLGDADFAVLEGAIMEQCGGA